MRSPFRKSAEVPTFEARFFDRARMWRSLEYLLDRQADRQHPRNPRGSGPSLRGLRRDARAYIELLLRAVEDGTYRLHPARPVTVYADKPRTVFRFEWPDELLLVHLARELAAWVEPTLSDTLYSFRKGRSPRRALARVASWLRERGGVVFVAKRDIRHYGESLDHGEVMRDFVRATGAGPRLVALVQEVCTFPRYEGDVVVRNTRGLPTGSYIQLVFENLHFHLLDLELAQLPGAAHVRFGDDMFFAARDAATFQRGRERMTTVVVERRLDFRRDKTVDVVLVAPHRVAVERRAHGDAVCTRVEHLGSVVQRDGELWLPLRKQRRVFDFLRARLDAVVAALGATCSATDRLRALVQVARALLVSPGAVRDNPVPAYLRELSSEHALRQIDRWLALTILQRAHGGGFSKRLFGRTSYRELRNLGLPSLVHLRRLHVL